MLIWNILAVLIVMFSISWKLGLGALLLLVALLYWRPKPDEPELPTPEQASELAEKAADLFEAGMSLDPPSHAYYCGVGIRYFDGVFVYDAVQDGELEPPWQYAQAQASKTRKEFTDRAEFVAWLAAEIQKPQPEGYDTITCKRLEKTVAAFTKARSAGPER